MVTKKIILGTSLTTVLGILIYLSTLQGVTIITSPNINCAGTINQPCVSYFNITSNYYTFKFYNTSSQKLSFSQEVKDYKIYRYVSRKWTEIKFPINMTKGVKYQFKLVGYKFKTTDNVKWGIQAGDSEVDPYWFGSGSSYATSGLIVEMPHQIIYSSEDTTTDSNSSNSYWNNNYTLVTGGYTQTTPLVNTSLSTWIGTRYMFRPFTYTTGGGTNTNPTYAYDKATNDTTTYAQTTGDGAAVGAITYTFNVSSNLSTTILYSFNGTSGGVQLYNFTSSAWVDVGVSSAAYQINFTYLQPYYINSTGHVLLRITSAGVSTGAYTRLWDTYIIYQTSWSINPPRYGWYKFPVNNLNYFDIATLNLYQQPIVNTSYGNDCNASYPCVTNLYYSSNQTWSNITWNSNPSFYPYILETKNLTLSSLFTSNSVGDDYVHSGQPNSNYGRESILIVTNNSEAETKIWMKFPTTTAISSAILNLYLYQNSLASAHNLNIYNSSNSTWDEFKITWNNQPLNDTNFINITVNPTDDNIWEKINVTNEYNIARANNKNLTIMITMIGYEYGDSGMTFCSFNYTYGVWSFCNVASQIPYLQSTLPPSYGWVNWTITNQLKSVLNNITYMLRIPMINIGLKAMNFTKSVFANRPYILTEVTKYLINESSCVSNPQSLCYQNGTFTPKGQTDSQWIFNISTNATGTLYANWNQSLPSCMSHFLSLSSIYSSTIINYTSYYNPNADTEYLTGVNNIEGCALITNTTNYYVNNITVKLKNCDSCSPANRYSNATIKLRSYINWTTPGNELASCFIKNLTDSLDPYNCTFNDILLSNSWVCINTTSYARFMWNSTNANDTNYLNTTYRTTGNWVSDGPFRRPYILLTKYLPVSYNVSGNTTNIFHSGGGGNILSGYTDLRSSMTTAYYWFNVSGNWSMGSIINTWYPYNNPVFNISYYICPVNNYTNQTCSGTETLLTMFNSSILVLDQNTTFNLATPYSISSNTIYRVKLNTTPNPSGSQGAGWEDNGVTSCPFGNNFYGTASGCYKLAVYLVSSNKDVIIGTINSNQPQQYWGFFNLNNCTAGQTINASLNFTVV